jgi:hypothetical protein
MSSVKIKGSVFLFICLLMKDDVSVIKLDVEVVQEIHKHPIFCVCLFFCCLLQFCKNCHFLECGLCIQNVIGIYVLGLFIYYVGTGCCYYV